MLSLAKRLGEAALAKGKAIVLHAADVERPPASRRLSLARPQARRCASVSVPAQLATAPSAAPGAPPSLRQSGCLASPSGVSAPPLGPAAVPVAEQQRLGHCEAWPCLQAIVPRPSPSGRCSMRPPLSVPARQSRILSRGQIPCEAGGGKGRLQQRMPRGMPSPLAPIGLETGSDSDLAVPAGVGRFIYSPRQKPLPDV